MNNPMNRISTLSSALLVLATLFSPGGALASEERLVEAARARRLALHEAMEAAKAWRDARLAHLRLEPKVSRARWQEAPTLAPSVAFVEAEARSVDATSCVCHASKDGAEGDRS